MDCSGGRDAQTDEQKIVSFLSIGRERRIQKLSYYGENKQLSVFHKFVLEHQGFSVFVLFQILILCYIVVGLFGRAVWMEFDAGSLMIKDEKVVVNDDNSFYITGRNDEETYGRWIAGSDLFDLRQGIYEISIDYWSLLYDTEVGGNCEDSTGTLQIIRSKTTENELCYNDLIFQDGHTHQRTRLWIRDIGGEKGLQFMVNFCGVGELRVDKITIKELPMWRFMKFLAWFLGFLMIDIAYAFFFIRRKTVNKSVAAVLIFASFFASLPLLTDSLFWGHDLDFHLNRIMALANGLEAGHIFVPIQTEVLNGYGYATPLFYSQLFLYLPAVLYNLAVPIQVCYQIYAIFVNIMTCMIAYYSFKGIVRDHKIAASGALIYLLAPYRITNLYIRAAVGEYTAMIFFPLLVYGFVKIYTKEEKKLGINDCLPIVIGLSGLIESHVLSCELSAMFIVVVCIVNFKKTVQLKRFVTLVEAAVLTLFVNMAFILPFLDSMQMDIRVNNEPVNHIQVQGAYLQQIFSVFQVSFGDSHGGMNAEMPLSLGIALVFGVFLFVACYSVQNEYQIRKSNVVKVGAACTIFTIVCVIFSLRFFPWDSLENVNKLLAKVLCMVQFPWRYLSMATVFAAVSTVIGLYIVKETKSVKSMQILGGMLCLLAILTNSLFLSIFTNESSIERVYGDADIIKTFSSKEYIISNTREENFRWRKILADENFVTVSDYQYKGGITTFDCKNIADTELLVEIPLMNYDNYHARDLETGKEFEIVNGTDNKVCISVPAHFEGSIRVTYEFPFLWKLSYAVSIIGVIIVAVIALFGRRRSDTDGL